MAYVKYNRKKTKLQAIDAATENPNTIYFTKESADSTSGEIIMGGVSYGGGLDLDGWWPVWNARAPITGTVSLGDYATSGLRLVTIDGTSIYAPINSSISNDSNKLATLDQVYSILQDLGTMLTDLNTLTSAL